MHVRAFLLASTLVVASGCSNRASAPDGAAHPGGRQTQRRTPDRPTVGPGDAAPLPNELDGRMVLHGAEGEVSVRVEVVKSQRERARGLMFREHLDEDAGMLFLFQAPEHQTFWMRNTLIPLDMVFIGADKRVVGVSENAAPRTDATRAVDGDSQYVLEVNAGFARRWGIGPGSRVEFQDIDETGVDP